MKTVPVYKVREIDERWNDQMQAIVEESPIEAAGMKIILDRSPDLFFLPRLLSEAVRCGGFFVNGQLSGFGMMLYKKVLINGTPERVLYFGNLVASRRGRGKGMPFWLSDFFLKEEPDNQLGYTVIMHGNVAARRWINRFDPQFPLMPHFRIIGSWRVDNILLIPRRLPRSRFPVRSARVSDIPIIAALLQEEYRRRLFAPLIHQQKIEQRLQQLPQFGVENFWIAQHGGEIVGVCCAWDMAPVKRNRVLAYNWQMQMLRCGIKALRPLLKYPPLPPPGKPFREVTILDYAVKGRDPEILTALLTALYQFYRHKGYHVVIIGHPVGDPLGRAVAPFFTQHLISDIFIFAKSSSRVAHFKAEGLPYIDMMLL